MRLGGEPAGRWGLTLLAATGIAGLVLALHGWAGRGSGIASPLAGGATGVTMGPARPGNSASPATSAPSAGPPASPSSGSPAAKAGPLLSSEPFASAAYQIWPGPVSSIATQALTGLTVSVRQRAGGLAVTAGVAGGQGSTHVYGGGVRVYVVEASFGDDSGNADYSLGDDALVVTNAQGRILE